MNLYEQEMQEREARNAGRADVLVLMLDQVTFSPARPLLVPPLNEEPPSHAPIQDVLPIDGEVVLHPPLGAELHQPGQLQG